MPECPTPWKQGYDERWAALATKVHEGQRAFHCPCGKWHLNGSNAPGRWNATGGRG